MGGFVCCFDCLCPCSDLCSFVHALQIFEHILIHGDIRKTTKLQVAGEEVEIEEFVEEEGEDTVKHSTAELANRESFVNMGKHLRQKVRPLTSPGR